MTRRTEVIINVVATTEGGRVGTLHVWADNINETAIQDMEGVTRALSYSYLPVVVYIDARYDAHEVAAELEELLLAKSPEASHDKARDSEASE